MNKNQFKAEDDTLGFELSVSKLAERKIKDVIGYISYFGKNTPVFKLTEIIFEDGTQLGIEGEHDCPYITVYNDDAFPNLSDEALMALDGESESE